MASFKQRLRTYLDDRKSPYPGGTRRKYFVGGLVALLIPITIITLGFFDGVYSGPGEWVYILVTPWHLLTLVGLYYISMSYLINEKRKRK